MNTKKFFSLNLDRYRTILFAFGTFTICLFFILENGCSSDTVTKVVTDSIYIRDTTFIKDTVIIKQIPAINSKYAMLFNGNDAYISISNIPSTTGTNSTRMVWVYVRSIPSKQQWIFGQGSRESIVIQDNGKVAFTNLFSTGWVSIADSIVVPTNRWVHFAAVETVDSLSTTIALFRDGNLINIRTLPEKPKVNSGCDLFIGGVKLGGAGECYFSTLQNFSGVIDEASIWSIALTKEQINAKMKVHLTPNENGLVGYYSFENSTGAIINDDSGNNNNGQLGGNGAIIIPLGSPFISNGSVIGH
ncbi:MAG: LamG domain-containing protein [Bacteroidetes bacterium]|nr:LamG domain-containing protein [Bacteroidota bacterium]